MKVVVVGGGLAGLSAALTARSAGAAVTILEKSARLGGNSAKASSGINGAATDIQMKGGIADSVSAMLADTVKSSRRECSNELQQCLCENSKDAIEWLQAHGVTLDAVVQLGGHSMPRTHNRHVPPGERAANVGFEIMKCLIDEAAADTAITTIANARVKELLTAGSASVKAVCGVEYVVDDGSATPGESIRLEADAVVLACGGYAADRGVDSLLRAHRPDLCGDKPLPTTNGSFATGDGIKMALAAGAKLVDMECVQVHPTSWVDPSAPDGQTNFLAGEALRGHGGILLNAEGKRFVDELQTRDHVTAKMQSHCVPMTIRGVANQDVVPPCALLVMGDETIERVGESTLAFYAYKKFVTFCNTLQELSEHTGIATSALQATFDQYRLASSSGRCPETGKTVFPSSGDLTVSRRYCVGYVTPAVHYSMGGCAINSTAEVLDNNDQPIPGLYAAGEVSGGVHGHNRLGGNSLLECVVFGLAAGRAAATARFGTKIAAQN
mmetsp:Transcript_70373/g.131646  ORF Transcript_70373/g.131646 Transcript_70373/m.131646 type:complete len:498 (-) Transcript_70373:203-1696(-)